jgi:hypothetical protein
MCNYCIEQRLTFQLYKNHNHALPVKSLHQYLTGMKNKVIILIFTGGICFLAACSGGRTPQSGNDTVKNTYKVAKDTSKTDTGKIAGSSDNSAAGGANLVKDTSKKVKSKK